VINLSGVVGQERAVEHVRRMLASGKLPHALLFVGPAGVGKATTAVALAAALNCERPGGGEGCTECTPCQKLAAGVHPDLAVLKPAGAGNIISIELVRELGARLGYPPHEARARVVLIEDADRMTAEAANAFLKTLEEPPPRTHFILVSAAPDRLLITILSRCQRVRFAPLDGASVTRILVATGVPEERARGAARLAGGSITRASELADGDRLERCRARVRALISAVRSGGFKSAVDAASELAQAKEEIPPTLALLALWYRDAAAVAADAPPSILAHGDELDALRAERADAGVLARRSAAVLEAQTALIGYANPQLTLERMILSMREGM
jgi:DNA polymerase-3 subunit delta'